LTKVSLYLFKLGNPGGITVSIRSSLDEEDITSYYLDADVFEEDKKADWYELIFPEVELVPSETYFIVFTEHEVDSTNIVYWAYGENNRYSNGLAWVNMGSWEELNVIGHPEPDFCFRTYYANTRSKNTEINTPFLNYLEKHPYLFPMLQQFLGLQ